MSTILNAPPPARAAITKFVSVRRSNRVPTLYWWNLPLPLRDMATLYDFAGTCGVVQPAAALGPAHAELGARDWPGGTARVADVGALLEARADGRVGPCSIAIFPRNVRDDELEPRMAHFQRDLERLPFTIALLPDGEGGARHRFCFRVPGKVIDALEHLALGRGFGGNAGQVEMALLQGLALRPNRVANLQLVMQEGGAALIGIGAGGRQRIEYLKSELGYTGLYEEMSLRAAVGERVRESWRRFPVGVVMFVGLPFFIAAFWIRNLFARPGARPRSKPGASKPSS